MNRSFCVLLCALFIVGCGASVQSGAARAAHMTSDGERYTAAIDEAHSAYEAEVTVADGMTFHSEAEADAVALTLGSGRLDYHLEAALRRRGLSVRGLRVYARNHDGFVTEQRATHLAQLEQIDRTVAGLGTHIVYDAADVDSAPEQIAAR